MTLYEGLYEEIYVFIRTLKYKKGCIHQEVPIWPIDALAMVEGSH
jgi:hypothetical protein